MRLSRIRRSRAGLLKSAALAGLPAARPGCCGLPAALRAAPAGLLTAAAAAWLCGLRMGERLMLGEGS
jgi:hypothetical protein